MAKSVLEMWAEANEQIELVTPEELAEELASGEVLLLDVGCRSKSTGEGRSRGSARVPRQVLDGGPIHNPPISGPTEC